MAVTAPILANPAAATTGCCSSRQASSPLGPSGRRAGGCPPSRKRRRRRRRRPTRSPRSTASSSASGKYLAPRGKEARKGRGRRSRGPTRRRSSWPRTTSITLSLISFTACYLLISAGIDVQQLLGKVGIAADETGGKVGTFALAYAAHKAASPIRFPPTVALTPVVANWIGKIRKGATDVDAPVKYRHFDVQSFSDFGLFSVDRSSSSLCT